MRRRRGGRFGSLTIAYLLSDEQRVDAHLDRLDYIRLTPSVLPHQQIDRPARAFARVLGAREIAQAALIARRPTRGRILAGAAVDATHAATMVALALLRPDRRKLALTNVATASAFAVAGVHQAKVRA